MSNKEIGGGGGISSSSSLEQILPIVSFKESDGDVREFDHDGFHYTIKTDGYLTEFSYHYYPYRPLTEYKNDTNIWIIQHSYPVFWEIDLGREVTNITKICLNTTYQNIGQYMNLIKNLELYSSLNGTDYSLITLYSHPNSTTSSTLGDPIELNVNYFKSRYIRFKFLDSYYSNRIGFGNLRIYRKPDDKVFLDKDNYIHGCKNNI